MALALLGLGSNVGDKVGNIRQALRLIGEVCTLKRVSRFYKTAPVGYVKQDWFINCAAEVDYDSTPLSLLKSLKSIEDELGRVEAVRFGPRVIDIDILFFSDQIVDESVLRVPHPRLHERLFVLAPLMDLSPDFVHPILKKTVRQMHSEVESQGGVEPADVTV